jgi:purine-binding chemotaxis protein CheW
VSKRPDNGDEIRSPDDSLANYFDDLLGCDDLLDLALASLDERPLSFAAASGGARVVSLPTKKTLDDRSTLQVENTRNLHRTPDPKLRLKPSPKTVPKPVAAYVEPELKQTREQKLQLEKLLQSARTQLLVEVPPITQMITSVTTDIKTAFVSDPEEIQDWTVEIPAVETSVETVEVAAAQVGQYQIDGLEWQENGRPQWAQSRFDVLLFKVCGLTLAVPLISLGQIQPLTDELTPLFGQADWFMGLQPTPAGKIRTVNTAKFVMPERYDETFLQTAKYVVSINGVPWGLAVDSVNQPITLMPEDVKWRSDRSKRPWLAGTVKEHMCALLDIPRIGQMLIEADKNFVAG